MKKEHWPAIAAVAINLLIAQSSPARADVAAPGGAKLFADLCSACHSVGGGDGVGPDLVKVAHWPREDLRKAVKRMEDNVGPLKPDQIEALVDLLQAPDAKERIAQAANPPAIEIPPEQKAASAGTGRGLFFGQLPLANRGIPCAACHAVAGRGGNLAVDLTAAQARRGDAALLAAAQQPGFPLMKAAYSGHPVTLQEAYHLLAFFQEAARGVAPMGAGTGVVHGTAAGITLVVLGGVAVLFRSRRAGVRSRMARKSSGGE